MCCISVIIEFKQRHLVNQSLVDSVVIGIALGMEDHI
jgi:hypothetical protein